MFEALRILARLSPAQRAVLGKKRLSGEFTAAALLDEMRALAAFDRSGDASRRSAGRWAVLAVVQVIIGVVLSAWWGKPALAYALLMAVAALVFGLLWLRLRRVDISANFGATALPFLAILKQDMEPQQKLTVDIDLSPATIKSKCQATLKPYQRGAYTKIVDTIYRDPWFSGSAQLADASVLRWRVTDEVKASRRTKRSRRGKYKMSTRHAKRSIIAVSLSLPNKTYAIRDAAQSSARLAIEPGDRRSTIRLGRKIKSKALDAVDPRALIDLVSEAYGRVAPAGSRG